MRSLARRNSCSLTSIALAAWARAIGVELGLESPVRLRTCRRPCVVDDIHETTHQLADATSKRPYWLDDLDIAQLSAGREDRFPVSSVIFNEGTMNELSPADLSVPNGAHRPLGRDVRFDRTSILRTSTTALTLDVAYRLRSTNR